MQTECTDQTFQFQALGRREVVARFDGGPITSDAGGLLLREVERHTGIIRQLARCFTDHRDEELTEHSVEELLRQRIFGLALGYEDLNDHDELRADELLAAVVGKRDVTGAQRPRARDRGKALAGKSTLNRLELTPADADASHRYKKILGDEQALARLWIDCYVATRPKAPERIVIDLDATDDPLHGRQEGRFFHGYYDHYCYLPLYIFIDDTLVWAELRPSNIDGARGSEAALFEILGRLWQEGPGVEILVRGDSGFCRENLMRLCEAWPGVDYVFGLPKNSRLKELIEAEQEWAKSLFEETGEAARVFGDFEYRTQDSWGRARRVVAKAEHLRKGANPRFVVTNLKLTPQNLYKVYRMRAESETRIKELLEPLAIDRMSCTSFKANQVRVLMTAAAYVILQTFRCRMSHTRIRRKQVGTLRLMLLKIAGKVRSSVRRITISLAANHPWREHWEMAARAWGAVPT